MSDLVYGIILAGGNGTRLWPLSRDMFPKQLYPLASTNGETLLQKTFRRLANIVDDTRILTVTNVKNESVVKIQLEKMKKAFGRTKDYRIITEPESRNTSPAVGLALNYIYHILNPNQDPIFVVMPCDHFLSDEKKFIEQIKKGIEVAKRNYIVLLGNKATKVDTSLGYMKVKTTLLDKSNPDSGYRVLKFIEKPDNKSCAEYVESSRYFTNSGIVISKGSIFRHEFQKYCIDTYKTLIASPMSEYSPTVSFENYEKLRNISLDYFLLEKTDNLAMLPLECDLIDIGSWENIYNVNTKDENNNYIKGNVIEVGTKDSFVLSTSKLIATVGIENTIVVETEDAILVCDKSRSQEVKSIYQKLKEENNDAYKLHKTIFRPWGCYTLLQEGEGFLIKSIIVNPKSKLSLQYHNHRSEHWVLLEGEAKVTKGEEVYSLKAGESIDIDIKEKHCLENISETVQIKILEVQRGKILDENDIVRLEDLYGRV